MCLSSTKLNLWIFFIDNISFFINNKSGGTFGIIMAKQKKDRIKKTIRIDIDNHDNVKKKAAEDNKSQNYTINNIIKKHFEVKENEGSED